MNRYRVVKERIWNKEVESIIDAQSDDIDFLLRTIDFKEGFNTMVVVASFGYIVTGQEHRYIIRDTKITND